MRRRRILLVDDDVIVLAAHERNLCRWGYAVRTVARAVDVPLELQRFGPDLILMDRYLPDGDGLELAGRISDWLGRDAPKILILSGSFDEEQSGRDSPTVARFLPKGLSAARLRQLIENALAGQRLSIAPEAG